MKKNALSILALTLCALYSIAPLIIHPEFISAGWDLSVHINRAFQVSASIKEGILYPRWLSESNGGYGIPAMIFYSPLFYLVTGFINLFVPSLIVSLKVTTFIGFLLSGISMYLFLRNFCNHIGSVAGGIAYQLLPYHTFDFYIRETLAETFGFFWFPLIFHFAYLGATKGRLPHWIGLSFSYAGIILTHIVSAYIFTFVIGAAALSFSVRENNLRVLLKFMLASLFGLVLSAVYFIPMFYERRFAHIGWLNEHWDYARRFLYVTENNSSPFYIQLENIAILQLLLVLTSLTLIYYRIKRYGEVRSSRQFIFFSSIFALSFFISTPYSMPIWRCIPRLQTIHFPWRWLIVSAFSTSALVGLTFGTFSFAAIKKDRFVRVLIAVFHALILCNIYLSSQYIMIAEPMQNKDLEGILRESGDVIEYRPIWLTDREKDFYQETKKPVVGFNEGTGTIEIISWNSQSRFFKVNVSIPSTVRISTFYYPGWTALINGKEIPIGIEKDSGAMLLNLSPGESMVLLEFRDTPLRRKAKYISALSLFIAIIVIVLNRSKNSRIGFNE